MYPDRNPFPPSATATANEGPEAAFALPTIKRQCISRLESVLTRYAADAPDGEGRAVCVYGPNGTGKTHTLLAVRSVLSAGNGGKSQREPVALYARADEQDPVMLYRSMAAGLTEDFLVQLAQEAVAGYTADEFFKTHDNVNLQADEQSELADAARAIGSDVEIATSVRERHYVSPTSVIRSQESELTRIEGGDFSFDRAVKALGSGSLASIAHRWLTGRNVTVGETEQLGVNGTIDSVPRVVNALHVIAALSRRARRPFFAYVDQTENVLLDRAHEGDAKNAGFILHLKNAGFIRAILEAVIVAGGAITFAMSELAWNKAPADLAQRLGRSAIYVPPLEMGEANDLISAWLLPWNQEDQQSIFPFTTTGVRQLLIESSGNARRFLQLCALAFDLGERTEAEITARTVVDAVRRSGATVAPSAEDVQAALAIVARDSGLELRNPPELSQSRVDATAYRDGRLLFAVEISNALFAVDEADQARQNLRLIESVSSQQANTILVVLGYASAPVVDALQQVARVVVASDDLEEQLRAVVSEILAGFTEPAAEGMEARLDSLAKQLEDLTKQRANEVDIVAARVAETLDRHDRSQVRSAFEDFQTSWRSEIVELEADISLHARGRERRDVEEVVALHESVLLERIHSRERLALLAVVGGPVALLASFVFVAVYQNSFGSQPLLLVSLLLIGGLIGALAFLYVRMRNTGDRPMQQHPGSVDELDRAANAFSEGQRIVPPRALRHPDPYLRYWAAGSWPIEVGYREVRAEPCALLRRLLVGRLVAEAPIKVALSTELDSATKTVVLEEISSGDPFLFKDAEARLTPELHVLALILGLPVRPRNPVETFLAEISGESGPASTHSVGGLTSAFVSGGDEDLATALKYVSEADLRRVAALLAPTETGGLTTCYWLRSVSRIEDVYLFIRRAQLLIARGLDSVPTSGPAAKETSG